MYEVYGLWAIANVGALRLRIDSAKTTYPTYEIKLFLVKLFAPRRRCAEHGILYLPSWSKLDCLGGAFCACWWISIRMSDSREARDYVSNAQVRK